MTYKTVQYKVGLFVILTVLCIVGALLVVAYKKDIFADLIQFRLESDSGEGLTTGMPVLFSGFEIGKVDSLELSDEGRVLITITVPHKHIRWVREGSTFTLERPLVGSPRIIVKTSDPSSPPLSREKVVPIKMVDDINEIIKKAQPLVEKIQSVADNLDRLTAEEGELQGIVSDTRRITKTLAEKKTLLEMMTGDRKGQEAVMRAVEQAAAAAEGVNTTIAQVRKVIENADESLLGERGSLATINRILLDLETKVKRLDALIENAITISADLQGGTQDIFLLRKEVDTTLSSVRALIQEVRNNLPFDQKKEIPLP